MLQSSLFNSLRPSDAYMQVSIGLDCSLSDLCQTMAWANTDWLVIEPQQQKLFF